MDGQSYSQCSKRGYRRAHTTRTYTRGTQYLMELLAVEDKLVALEQLEKIEDDKRDEVEPVEALPDAVSDTSKHGRASSPNPNEAQDAHVAVLVVRLLLLLPGLDMGLVVTRGNPGSCGAQETILDSHEIRVLLEGEDVVDVEVVVDARPEAEDDRGVNEGGDSEEAVIPENEIRVQPDEEGTGKVADEDHEGGR